MSVLDFWTITSIIPSFWISKMPGKGNGEADHCKAQHYVSHGPQHLKSSAWGDLGVTFEIFLLGIMSCANPMFRKATREPCDKETQKTGTCSEWIAKLPDLSADETFSRRSTCVGFQKHQSITHKIFATNSLNVFQNPTGEFVPRLNASTRN